MNKFKDLKSNVGFSICDIACIFDVKISTAYKYIKGKSSAKNKKRLKLFYDMCNYWKTINIGRIGNYLHKEYLGVSLLDLLKNKNSSLQEIKNFLDKINIALGFRDQNKQIEIAKSLEEKAKKFGADFNSEYNLKEPYINNKGDKINV